MVAFCFHMIALVCGTNREDSVSRKITGIYKNLLEAKGETVYLIDLIDLPSNFLTEILYNKPEKHPEFGVFISKLSQANKYVFIVPEYNGSFPGVLKSFIDGLPYPSAFDGKKAALLGLSSEYRERGLP